MDGDGRSPWSDEYMAWCRARYLNPASRISSGVFSRSKAESDRARGDRALAYVK